MQTTPLNQRHGIIRYSLHSVQERVVVAVVEVFVWRSSNATLPYHRDPKGHFLTSLKYRSWLMPLRELQKV